MKNIEFPITIPQNQLDELNRIVKGLGSPNGKVITILNNFVNENGICPPTAEEIIPLLQKLRDSLVAENVVQLILFGSVARGEADRGSDIDIMAEISGKVGVSSLSKIEKIIEKSLGRKYKIDVVAKTWLKSEVLESALNEGILIF